MQQTVKKRLHKSYSEEFFDLQLNYQLLNKLKNVKRIRFNLFKQNSSQVSTLQKLFS